MRCVKDALEISKAKQLPMVHSYNRAPHHPIVKLRAEHRNRHRLDPVRRVRHLSSGVAQTAQGTPSLKPPFHRHPSKADGMAAIFVGPYIRHSKNHFPTPERKKQKTSQRPSRRPGILPDPQKGPKAAGFLCGMRNGMTPMNHPTGGLLSFKGLPRFIQSFLAQRRQVVKAWY